MSTGDAIKTSDIRAKDHSASGALREVTDHQEYEAGPSSGPSNGPASQSASNSAGPPSRLKLEIGLYRCDRDLKEMRQEMDLSWPRQSGHGSLSSDDEIEELERRLSELKRIQDTLQQTSILMSDELAMSEGLTRGKSMYQGTIRQGMEMVQSGIQSSCELVIEYQTLIDNVKKQMRLLDLDQSYLM
ncbi:hypothetical protein QAD02_004777 [Eretmocerus hayati]|uniref:Uncharacterized protein n=1 Tax=Eretmocerus hayati TaxID=131215 RepID=A0ACC2NVB8_9HYME|nr:hypothetical protein QAD02_004777 [Eretmocerus hayati]